MYPILYGWVTDCKSAFSGFDSHRIFQKKKERGSLMNIVNAGSRFQVYGEDVRTFKELPVGSYDVGFHPMQGFWLQSREDLVVREEKIYGSHVSRVKKVLSAYEASDRNLGVILSGQKGIGKSLFARVLAEEAIKIGLPLINVSMPIDGIASFLSSIHQQVIVLFDEFEKLFAKTQEGDPQTELLGLFDGTDAGKKLFVITCNDFTKLNEFFLNRPGRFHYHFMLQALNKEEIQEYMFDQVKPEYQGCINDIVSFGMRTDLTYDCLRAIAFELNRGYGLQETLDDLNITRTEALKYTFALTFSDGKVIESRVEQVDLFSGKKARVWLGDQDEFFIKMFYNASDIALDSKTGFFFIDPKRVSLDYSFDYLDKDITDAEKQIWTDRKIAKIDVIRYFGNGYRYAV